MPDNLKITNFADRTFIIRQKIWQNLRFGAVEEAFKKRPLEVKTPTERPEQFYGKYVFNRARMYKYLPVDVYQS